MNGQTSSTDNRTEDIPGFEIERQLAQGGMATVYLATQLSLKRKVALKLLRAFNDPEHKARFFNESRIIASLNHRNIITIHDVGQSGEHAFVGLFGGETGELLGAEDAEQPLRRCILLQQQPLRLLEARADLGQPPGQHGGQ